MNRREMFGSSAALIAGLAGLGAVKAAPVSGKDPFEPIPYAILDRVPDSPAVMGLAGKIEDAVYVLKPDDCDYGCRMRILSKSLAVLHEERRRGALLNVLPPSQEDSGVSRGIKTTVLLVRKEGLSPDESERAVVQALGRINEAYRLAHG
jgi:hypothetical protein